MTNLLKKGGLISRIGDKKEDPKIAGGMTKRRH